MSAEANIKNAYEHAGAKVVSIKRHTGDTYRVEFEVKGRRMRQFAKDPVKSSWKGRRLFEKSLRDLHRFAVV